MNVAMLDRLIKQLEHRGLTIKPGEKPDELLLCGPASERTPQVMTALKQFKPLLLERFGRNSHAAQVETIRQDAAAEGWAESDPEPD